ncbi:MAG: DUF4136 domain-containing protein [Woeseiaceae bacterium]|nr:DUF4136 domain-containing protein [Woeseiaceae bacterium]
MIFLNQSSGCLKLALCVFLLGGCASGPKIVYDYDSSADFGQYRTYNFMENAGPDSNNYQSFFTRYVTDAITEEMEKRGYTKSDNPDLLINFNAILEDKTKVTTSPAPMPMGGYYGYRGGYYGGWGVGYGFATETHVSQYTEGTFNIDIVDAKKMQLVWEAVGIGRVTDDTMENLEQKVKEGVPRYFEGYPFVAGSSTPVTPEQG